MSDTQLRSNVIKAGFFKQLGYATVWEDERIIERGLAPKKGQQVFSITSGGDFSLQCLLSGAKVISLDFNARQTYLLEFKKAAVFALDYDELWEVLGLSPSFRRIALYQRLRPHLTKEARAYWDGRSRKLRQGMLLDGKQDRYLQLLGKVLTRLQGRQTVDALFACPDSHSQRNLFDQTWKTWRWRVFSSLLFSRCTLNFFYHKDHFRFAQKERHPADIFREQTQRVLRDIPIQDNFYLHWLFFCTYPDHENCPAWLRRSNFETLKACINNLTIKTGEFEQFIYLAKSNSIDCFNFSNIFDWVDEEVFKHIMQQVVRIARKNARLCYWTNAVNTKRDLALVADELPRLQEDVALSRAIFEHCRTPGYSSCTVGRII